MTKIVLKVAVFFTLIGAFWYFCEVYALYNKLIAAIAFKLSPLYDGLGITQGITASGNQILFYIKNVIEWPIEKSFSNNFHFTFIIFPPLLLATVKKRLRTLLLYLLIGLFILMLWNSFYVISHIKVTYATELNTINRINVGFSSENFSPAEAAFYVRMRKFSQHGARILPVFLWLCFFLLSRRAPALPMRVIQAQKPGRNAPCPCGSGLKFKHCCARKR